MTTIRNHLLWLISPPLVWAAHFLASYLTIAIFCAKSADGNATAIRIAVATYTIVALMLIGIVGVHSFRQHRFGNQSLPHDDDTASDQLRFVGYSTLLLAVLSAVATLFTTLVVVFIGNCD